MAALPMERPRYVCFYRTTLRGAAEKSALLQMMEAREVGAEKLTRSCPAGIDVTLILSSTYLSKRDPPKVLITAKRRSWRCLSSAWAQQSVKERKLVPTEGHVQDLRRVLAHVRLNEVGANDE